MWINPNEELINILRLILINFTISNEVMSVRIK
jgi:hypothetical protein